MKLAFQILLMVFSVLAALGSLGEKNKDRQLVVVLALAVGIAGFIAVTRLL